MSEAILRRVRVYTEVGVLFGIDHSGTPNDFLDMPFVEAKFSKGRKFIDTAETKQIIDDYAEEVRGPDEPTLSLKFNLGVPTPGANTTMGALGAILDVMFGDNDNSPADTVQGAGATSTVIPVTSGAAWQPGNAMGVVIGGVVYIREVKSISSNDVTLKYALPSAPAAASVIIGCQTWFPGVGSNDGSTSKTLQVIVNTKVGDQQFCLVGGHITGVTLDTPIGGLPTISSEWTFADIFQISDTLADATYSYNHLVAMDSEFRCATTATTTVSQVHANSATFKLNLTWQKQKTFGGVNTYSGYTRVQKAPVIEGEFTIPSEDDSWDDHADNRDDMMISLQIGESPTFGCLQLVAPTVQITETDLDPIDGIEGQKIPWKGRRDENTTGGSDAYLNTAAFRIHFARTLAA